LVNWAPLVFPLWILLISVHILLANFKRTKNQDVNLTSQDNL